MGDCAHGDSAREDRVSADCAGGDRAGRTSLSDEPARVLANRQLAPGIHMMELECPRIAGTVASGQFVHMQIPGMESHVLRRPFSVCSWSGDALKIMYQVVGTGSRRLSQLAAGEKVRMIGPVGRGWNPPAATRRALLVCGGMGSAPQTMLARQLVESGAEVDCLVGATTADRLVVAEPLAATGARMHFATDDGSEGHHGFCTELIGEFAPGCGYVAVCGPEPMERSAVRALQEAGVLRDAVCEVSLERRMACGVGACLSCVIDTVHGKKRACVDGPVFEAGEVMWQ